jgi:hypothetical protein
MLIRNDLAPGEGLALTAPVRLSASESQRMLRNSFDASTEEWFFYRSKIEVLGPGRATPASTGQDARWSV